MATRRWATAAFVGIVAIVGLGAPRHLRADDAPPAAGMRAKVFPIKHRSTDSLVHALKPLTSGAAGAMLRESDNLRTVTVRDFPENLAAIEQAIRRLDVPRAAKPDIELNLRILVASPEAGPNNTPPDLADVVRQLGRTLAYRSYVQVAAVTQRVREGSDAGGKGEVTLPETEGGGSREGSFQFDVDDVELVEAQSGPKKRISIDRLRVRLKAHRLGETEVKTGLTLRDGEKVVVGTGALKSRAMIVVVSASVRQP